MCDGFRSNERSAIWGGAAAELPESAKCFSARAAITPSRVVGGFRPVADGYDFWPADRLRLIADLHFYESDDHSETLAMSPTAINSKSP